MVSKAMAEIKLEKKFFREMFMKKLFLTAMAVASAAAVFLAGCSDISESESDSEKQASEQEIETLAVENVNSEIVLGDKFENLFTIEQVNARNAASGMEEVEANYIYFRCRSNDIEKQKWLNDRFELLSIIPLDREILEGGTIYKDPEIPDGECPWFYLMKPIEEYDEVVEQGLAVEILDKMYIDDEDSAVLSGEGLEIPEDTYLTVDLEEENSRGIFKRIKKFLKKYVANHPKGKVQVYDNVQGRYVPVRNVQVMSQQLGVFGIKETDRNGNFTIPRAYTSLGGKVQIMVSFKNSNMTLNAPGHGSNFFGNVIYYEGWHWIEGISDLEIKIKDDLFDAKCATIMNAYSDYCDYCSLNRITKPTNLSIWSFANGDNSCAPLARHTTGIKLPKFTNSIANFLGIPVPSLDMMLLPDIVIGTEKATGKDLTEKIYSKMFHELSHASHYFGLGKDARKVWFNEYGDMVLGWVQVLLRGEKISENPYNNGGTDLVKLIESWGYFSGNYAMEWKYPGGISGRNYKNILEDRKLDKKSETEKDESKPYFYYGGLYDLIDYSNETDVDFTSGYTYNQLFRALTSSNVRNLNSFANALATVSNRKSDLPNVIRTLEKNHD